MIILNGFILLFISIISDCIKPCATNITFNLELFSNDNKLILNNNIENNSLSVNNIVTIEIQPFIQYFLKINYRKINDENTIFHRVIPGFMIQGGGFGPDMAEKTSFDPIQNEANNGVSNACYPSPAVGCASILIGNTIDCCLLSVCG